VLVSSGDEESEEGVWNVCGVEEGCEILFWWGGRVEVFLGLMDNRGREIRNQIQGCVVLFGVGLFFVSLSCFQPDQNEKGWDRRTDQSHRNPPARPPSSQHNAQAACYSNHYSAYQA
jgi:hypothetical protein